MACSAGDIHCCITSFVIMVTHTVLLNIKVGKFIVTALMITNESSGWVLLFGLTPSATRR